MSQPTATIDTSVLLSLQAAELLGALSVLFDRILVPKKVRFEIANAGARNDAALAALTDYAIFENCDDYDVASVRLLLDTRESLKKGRDEGEAEAVIQASRRRSNMVLVDDSLGRKWASTHSIECHGTIWVCRELRRTGYLTALRPCYLRLIQSGRRQPLNEMNRFLEEFGEPPLTGQDYLGTPD